MSESQGHPSIWETITLNGDMKLNEKQFHQINVHDEFYCEWRSGLCKKLNDTQAIDGQGKQFGVNPLDWIMPLTKQAA